MSKNKKTKKNTTVGVSVDTEVSPESMFDEVVKWEDLKLAREDAVGSVLKNQQLVVELSKMKKEAIDKDKTAYEIVNGLLNTYNEIANDIRTISLEHSLTTDKVKTSAGTIEVPKTFKSGVIDNSDDELTYIGIATNYISAIEKVGHITGTTYPDLLVKLGMENAGIDETYKDAVKTAEGITDGK